jgi:hypothetical protein
MVRTGWDKATDLGINCPNIRENKERVIVETMMPGPPIKSTKDLAYNVEATTIMKFSQTRIVEKNLAGAERNLLRRKAQLFFSRFAFKIFIFSMLTRPVSLALKIPMLIDKSKGKIKSIILS